MKRYRSINCSLQFSHQSIVYLFVFSAIREHTIFYLQVVLKFAVRETTSLNETGSLLAKSHES
jgi:hypothetical protein